MAGKNRPGSFKKFRSRFIEYKLKQSDELVCEYCGVQLVTGVHPPISTSLTVDHIVPISMGGGLKDMSNMRICCWKCNNQKGSNLQEVS